MNAALAWYIALPAEQRKRAWFYRLLNQWGKLEPPPVAAERVPFIRGRDPGDETAWDPASAQSA